MTRSLLPTVTRDTFGTIPRFVIVGLLLIACAGCSWLKRVPAEDLEAERQRRDALQVSHRNLLMELENQQTVRGELEEKLTAESSKSRKLQVEQQELEKKLNAKSVAQTELLEQLALQNLQQKELERQLKQQTAARDALYNNVEELEKQINEEDIKRQEWEQWQEQLERDLVQQTASNNARAHERLGESEKQLAGDNPEREEWAFWVEEQDSKEQSTAREMLDYGDANLYLLLLEKKAYIARLAVEIEKVILEVVRAKAKLRSLESKAEAASNLAEAELAVESLRARGEVWKSDPSVIKAEQLTTLSAREFEEGNYGGALYLTSQAKSLIEGAQARSLGQEKSPVVEGEVPFLLPLTLQLLGKSNVRKGPGSKFDVMFSWESGTTVVGHAFKGQWVRVTNEGGLGGWIFYKSVGSD
jgi:preprotein translocase subunit SecD